MKNKNIIKITFIDKNKFFEYFIEKLHPSIIINLKKYLLK